MRIAYSEDLESFAHDLIIMCDTVHSIMSQASEALLTASLEHAEQALSSADELEEVRIRCEERAVQLLALEGPVARDLRQVISSIYIVEDFDRMAALSMHIAKAARRRHPSSAIPEPTIGYFQEMSRLVDDMMTKTHDILVDLDVEVAMVLSEEDDAVDDLHEFILNMLTQREWKHSTREAVDVTLLARFYERYADHCVNVAARVVYLASGFKPDDYLAQKERNQANAEMERRFAELERQFSRRRPHEL
ncbi:phosphate signaling complex protein PhoU [Corynebacterium alimapuense]|uniref:Phosphate-specific transport system accessory protein PhoU n=1 Tax=Corynebacterium alimapuense TaxID=1576874 RepID=A0A3M8K9C1_9CORY|nr:phosphate signaling complex protein PhoU [Corynebacterium alimapuense]RNE49823.1 phosphate transport system regulatory protein PhoU [Corynebacterium alimapuense]